MTEHPLTTERGQFAIRVFILFSLALATYIVALTAHVLLLLFAGTLFGIFLDATAIPLRHFRMGRGWSLAIVSILFFSSLLATIFLASPVVIKGLQQLTTGIPQGLKGLSELAPPGFELEERFSRQAGSLISEALQRAAGVFSTTVGAVVSLFVILLMGLYSAAEFRRYKNGTVLLFPPNLRRPVEQTLGLLGYALRWWLLGRISSMVIVGLLTWGALVLLGLPFAGLLALIAGLLSFVPNIGPVVSAVPAVLVGFGQSLTVALTVVAIYLTVQTIESYAISPLIQRKTVLMPPALIFTAQLTLGALFGVLGLLVATPLTVCALVAIKKLYLHETLGEPIKPI